MHPGGFEPPTARFVAEYSIQLSYGCIGIYYCYCLYSVSLQKQHKVKYGASGRIRTSDRSVRSRVLYPAELRMHRDLLLYFSILISLQKQYEVKNGASGRIRTSDRSVRSRVLYPAELRMHRDLLLYCSIFISLRKQYEVIDGASGRIRTSDRSVRSRVLYPAELRMQNGGEAGIRTPDAAFDRILP